MKQNLINQPIQLGIAMVLIIGAIFFLNSINPNQPTENNEPLLPQVEQANQNELDAIYPKAPEIAGITHWINSEPLTMASLKGKVVLVDFWTYSCINCLRTLPYMNDWQKKYADKGLVIIGVHAPEFAFEKEIENVKQAIQKYAIQYPVALDNDYATWNNYSNRYWPAKYLIDANGRVRYYHFGEGNYDETEEKIQELLQEVNQNDLNRSLSDPVDATDVDFTQIRTPELYFGKEFKRQPFGNEPKAGNNPIPTYTLPAKPLSDNLIYLDGNWAGLADHQRLTSAQGKIVLNYSAKSVHLVLGSTDPVAIEIWIDDQKVKDMVIQEEQLYELATFETASRHELEIRIKNYGLRAYAFTFG